MFVGAPHIFSGVWMCKGRNHLQSTLIAHLTIISKSARGHYTPETDCEYPKCICDIVFRPNTLDIYIVFTIRVSSSTSNLMNGGN